LFRINEIFSLVVRKKESLTFRAFYWTRSIGLPMAMQWNKKDSFGLEPLRTTFNSSNSLWRKEFNCGMSFRGWNLSTLIVWPVSSKNISENYLV